jgi:hypothetical protein
MDSGLVKKHTKIGAKIYKTVSLKALRMSQSKHVGFGIVEKRIVLAERFPIAPKLGQGARQES